VGPGRRLATLLGDAHSIVGTVYCGDNHAASDPGAVDAILALIKETGAEVVVAGPAFTSGRYGIACARVASAAASAGLVAIASMHADNPGADDAPPAMLVASGVTAREMGDSLQRIAGVIARLAAGEPVGPEDGLIVKASRKNRMAERNSAERAVDLVLARLGGDRDATEIPRPVFGDVVPAAPVADLAVATVALVTEGALVPMGNPDRLESARATKWLRYPLAGTEVLATGDYQCVHGGFSPGAADADPHRILPLDAARDLERSGRIRHLHTEYLVTVGNGTAVADAARFGAEWAAELLREGVAAAILTAT
jgi:glycine reductase